RLRGPNHQHMGPRKTAPDAGRDAVKPTTVACPGHRSCPVSDHPCRGTTMRLSTFIEVWILDFEFWQLAGERPEVLCLVAKELWSGRVIRLWRDELLTLREPPFDVGPQSLCVAYFSSAEWNCFLTLGWRLPVHVLDLYAEFRLHTSGRDVP